MHLRLCVAEGEGCLFVRRVMRAWLAANYKIPFKGAIVITRTMLAVYHLRCLISVAKLWFYTVPGQVYLMRKY